MFAFSIVATYNHIVMDVNINTGSPVCNQRPAYDLSKACDVTTVVNHCLSAVQLAWVRGGHHQAQIPIITHFCVV